jgi:hypothetical protein
LGCCQGDGEIFEPVTCTACGRIHLVNPKSGKVLETGKKYPSTTRYKLPQLGDIRRNPPRVVAR